MCGGRGDRSGDTDVMTQTAGENLSKYLLPGCEHGHDAVST